MTAKAFKDGTKRIRWLVMDVDGTLTDGKIYIGQDGREFKTFDIKDGYGIRNILPEYGIEPVIITGKSSEIVRKRCEELKIYKVYQGVQDKTRLLQSIIPVAWLSLVAYIGDDLNDIAAMKMVRGAGGIVGCPSDAVMSVRQIADYVASKSGGSGAVREFIEWMTTL